MNLFCLLLQHTWVPHTDDPSARWNTTKDGLILVPTTEGDVRYYDRCQRCGATREARVRGDYDRRGEASAEGPAS